MEADKIKESIKRAAQELFRKFGYHKTSVNEIAKKAKIAKATIYKYFDSKEDVLHALLMDYIRVSVDELIHSNMTEMDEEAQLNNLIMKTCRLSYTVCNEFIGWDFIRESANSQEFLKNLSNELEEMLVSSFTQLSGIRKHENYHAAHALPDQMQQKHRVQLRIYLGKRLRRAQKFCFLSKRDIALFG